MADRSKIEWTDASWTPIRARNKATGKIGWHCEHVSEGCRNCYAEAMNRRLGTGLEFKPGHRGDIEIFLDEKMLLAPLRWKRPRMIFVCSMTDLFADFVPDQMLDKMFAVMALCPQHTFQVLTKRPRRMREYMNAPERKRTIAARVMCVSNALARKAGTWKARVTLDHFSACFAGSEPFRNVWLGTSCEDQPTADARIPDLLATPAAVRFVSAEPLLSPIDLERVGSLDSICAAMPEVTKREEYGKPKSGAGSICGVQIDAIGLAGSSITFFQTPDHMGGFTAASPRLWPRLDWVIVGGESGPHARPMHPDWARSLRDQCVAVGIPFFFKQWGEWADAEDWPSEIQEHLELLGKADGNNVRVGKHSAGRLLDCIEHNAMPETRT